MFNKISTKRKSMKKITLMALACAMFMVPAVANAQEVTYVEDPAQGYTFNRFQDNWFVQGLGGAGIMMSRSDNEADFADRIGWKGALMIGKWFSPVAGVRFGGEFNQMKGLTAPDGYIAKLGVRADRALYDGKFLEQQFNDVGGAADFMLNMTNWILGYKPGRFYNATLYAGASAHWVWERENQGRGDWKYAGDQKGDNKHSRHFGMRAGLMNSFRLTNHIDALLDLRFEEIQEHIDGWGHRTWNEYVSAQLGIAYKFNNTEWTAPVVPVCPEYKYTNAEGDALVARLSQADRKIADLENQLRNCAKPQPAPQPGPAPVADSEAPLATIYYPINVSKIVGVQNDVVDAVAEVMKSENKTYTLTGWADNYTGNDKINTRLRKDRVAGVKAALTKKGIDENRLSTQIIDSNRPEVDFGPKSAPLSRAVTIVRNK